MRCIKYPLKGKWSFSLPRSRAFQGKSTNFPRNVLHAENNLWLQLKSMKIFRVHQALKTHWQRYISKPNWTDLSERVPENSLQEDYCKKILLLARRYTLQEVYVDYCHPVSCIVKIKDPFWCNFYVDTRTFGGAILIGFGSNLDTCIRWLVCYNLLLLVRSAWLCSCTSYKE